MITFFFLTLLVSAQLLRSLDKVLHTMEEERGDDAGLIFIPLLFLLAMSFQLDIILIHLVLVVSLLVEELHRLEGSLSFVYLC